ncbi:hypothetical protein JCM9140_2328 [Halalkalibacter wakoensis JCM 9140]|uniref:Uncharacterized protein n=1 Tax=Halalkalibacter wakoensis JCM 9140 TaxID=1236970 RepID=W4Q4I7_9BACI|nr:SLAP domain-containing protein [Halalkalibacter wakoensis]GAE26279.1 hypothetical protein JCM9140_2328 [Halalkalibacter wakoensis JCM 9140]
MTMYETGKYKTIFTDEHMKLVPLQEVRKINEMITGVSLPEGEAGIIGLDLQVQEGGLLVFALLFNTTQESVEDKHLEFQLYDVNDEMVAGGYMAKANLPELKPNEVHFWYFFFPNESFMAQKVDLAAWRLSIQGKSVPYEEGKEIETTRQYSFYQIMQNQVTPKMEDHLNRVSISLGKTETVYKSAFDLQEEEEDEIRLSDKD